MFDQNPSANTNQADISPKTFDEFKYRTRGILENVLLRCKNGGVSLANGNAFDVIEAHSSMANVSIWLPESCAAWDELMIEATDGNEEYIDYLQQVLYLSLLKQTPDMCYILQGSSANIIAQTFMTLIGSYGVSVHPDFVSANNEYAAVKYINDLNRDIRTIRISEPDQSTVLSSEAIMALISRNPNAPERAINAAYNMPGSTVLITTTSTQLPKFSNPSIFGPDCVAVIPLHDCMESNYLKSRLLQPKSLTGILNWCVYHKWIGYPEFTYSMKPPAVVVEATNKLCSNFA